MQSLNDYVKVVEDANQKWWQHPVTGEPLNRNKAEMLMLTVSELAEAMEGDRKNLMDDHLPQYRMYDVELVDAIIRIFDQLAHRGVDTEEIFWAKMKYNAQRADHKPENRLKEGGKAY